MTGIRKRLKSIFAKFKSYISRSARKQDSAPGKDCAKDAVDNALENDQKNIETHTQQSTNGHEPVPSLNDKDGCPLFTEIPATENNDTTKQSMELNTPNTEIQKVPNPNKEQLSIIPSISISTYPTAIINSIKVPESMEKKKSGTLGDDELKAQLELKSIRLRSSIISPPLIQATNIIHPRKNREPIVLYNGPPKKNTQPKVLVIRPIGIRAVYGNEGINRLIDSGIGYC